MKCPALPQVTLHEELYWVKSVPIWSFFGPYFPALGMNTESPCSVRMRQNTDQKNSEYRHFSRSATWPLHYSPT